LYNRDSFPNLEATGQKKSPFLQQRFIATEYLKEHWELKLLENDPLQFACFRGKEIIFFCLQLSGKGSFFSFDLAPSRKGLFLLFPVLLTALRKGLFVLLLCLYL